MGENEDIRALRRELYGHNGTDGVLTRVARLEERLDNLSEDIQDLTGIVRSIVAGRRRFFNQILITVVSGFILTLLAQIVNYMDKLPK